MIIRHTDFSKTVSNITERDNLLRKINNMIVIVQDATDDIDAGPGKATYRYYNESWFLISKSTDTKFTIETEELPISNGKVIPGKVITDNIIWEVMVVNGDVVEEFLRLEDLTIRALEILGLDAYEGKSLRFTYVAGTLNEQIQAALDGKVDKTYSDSYSIGEY